MVRQGPGQIGLWIEDRSKRKLKRGSKNPEKAVVFFGHHTMCENGVR